MFRLPLPLTARLVLAAMPAFALACGDDQASPADAGPAPADAPQVLDALILGDAPPALAWVDFAIGGCTLLAPDDAGVRACQGPAPLRVQLSAVAPAAVEVFLWELSGIAAPDADAGAPAGATISHMFELPGTYDVSLTVRGPGGTAMITRRGAVIVTPAELGAQCGRDAQCGQDRTCVCGVETTCPAPLAAGLCSAACDAETPCAEGVCTSLAPEGADAPADWQRALCLPACGPAGACPQGLTCQELRAGDGTGWVQACFAPGVLGRMGSPCKDASGALDHEACAGGLCLDIGARGACAAPCADTDCPASSACASFGKPEQSACLLRCADAAVDCQADPWLACEAPGMPGGFTVGEPASPAGYCAPRACSGPEDCGVDGTCTAQGTCGPR